MPENLNPFENTDFIVAIDVSASMGQASVRNPQISRFSEASELAIGISSGAEKFDDDGIDIVLFGQGATIQTGLTSAEVAKVFDGKADQYATDTHTMVEVCANRQKTTGKDTIVIVITDGAPTDKNATSKAIIDAGNALTHEKALSFGFIQVGGDAAAASFLDSLDDDLESQGAKYDIVDAINSEAAKQMDIVEMLTKFQND